MGGPPSQSEEAEDEEDAAKRRSRRSGLEEAANQNGTHEANAEDAEAASSGARAYSRAYSRASALLSSDRSKEHYYVDRSTSPIENMLVNRGSSPILTSSDRLVDSISPQTCFSRFSDLESNTFSVDLTEPSSSSLSGDRRRRKKLQP